MKMKMILGLMLMACTAGYPQQIDWNPATVLQLSDFQNPGTDLNGRIITLHPGITVGFGYEMMAAQLMFTKNFNAKVSCTFNPQNALMVAPDGETARRLLAYSQYSFDTAELYARKLRKLLYGSKKTTSSADFYVKHYQDIEREMSIRVTDAGKRTNLGEDEALLSQLHKEVLAEIETYPDFCKACKPSRKK